MAAISRPVIYGGLALAAIGAYVFLNGNEDKPVQHTAPKVASKKPEPDWIYPATETSMRFEKPKGAVRNVFAPLFGGDKVETKAEQDQLMKVPANLAAGEADWAYTGMVEVDGTKMALLENGTTHQGGYVREGETWKKSRIEHITMASIEVIGMDGDEQTVFRYNANATPKPKPQPDPGFHPMDLSRALQGQIGLQINRDESDPKPGTQLDAPVKH